jgi:hypothetical protein
MIMSIGTGTYEATFTVADIKKVADRFAADYTMISQATGLHTRANVDKNTAEIKIYAEAQYLHDIDITLLDAAGKELRAAHYKISDSASNWSGQQPGNNMWPSTPAGRLRITVNLNKKWFALTPAQRDEFNKKNGIAWGIGTDDLSHPTLVKEFDRRFASNGYGMEKNIFKAV